MTYLHVAIDIEQERLLAKVDQDVVARFSKTDGRIELSFNILEVDVSKRDPWKDRC